MLFLSSIDPEEHFLAAYIPGLIAMLALLHGFPKVISVMRSTSSGDELYC